MKSSATSISSRHRQPTSTRGHRPGDRLYGDSLVCLRRRPQEDWHYQSFAHGLSDYDTPAAPHLIDINVDGRRIKAVAQVTRPAFVYMFDRVTGQPVWPIKDSRGSLQRAR